MLPKERLQKDSMEHRQNRHSVPQTRPKWHRPGCVILPRSTRPVCEVCLSSAQDCCSCCMIPEDDNVLSPAQGDVCKDLELGRPELMGWNGKFWTEKGSAAPCPKKRDQKRPRIPPLRRRLPPPALGRSGVGFSHRRFPERRSAAPAPPGRGGGPERSRRPGPARPRPWAAAAAAGGARRGPGAERRKTGSCRRRRRQRARGWRRPPSPAQPLPPAAFPSPGPPGAAGRCGQAAAGLRSSRRLCQPEAHQAQRTTVLTIRAQKATARSHQDSPQYHTITRRRSSWQASSGSTAAESGPMPRELQA
ncbi:serine/arginine repetitive matrix protein 1-like [Manacus candei]|uniref:serine/arginine repetitive matrix protein 1-like n=1 Tax=Manacus candei TaxID=415023 RepID=UPI002226AB02|nr:serine/arginine repetitive matrix protein 1-like [Manacus candei]